MFINMTIHTVDVSKVLSPLTPFSSTEYMQDPFITYKLFQLQISFSILLKTVYYTKKKKKKRKFNRSKKLFDFSY